MSLIKWEESLSVKIEKIDTEHKQLVAMINVLHEAIQIGKEMIILDDLLNDLLNYAIVHFKNEENYFSKYSYPEADKHSKEHKFFVSKINEFKKELKKDVKTVTLDVMDFLKTWLIKHIQKSDMKYSAYLNDRGLIPEN